MRFVTRNVRFLHRSGSLTTADRELAKYKLDFVGVQDRGGGRKDQGIIFFFYGKRNGNHQLGTGFFGHQSIVSAVKTGEFVSDRMSYIDLAGECACTE